MTGFASVRDRDLAKVMKSLGGLEPHEVEALNRFYIQGQGNVQIAAELRIDISRLRKLKSRVKQAYRAMDRPN
jgi:DNA-directed RNA polymerase specialized sigma24 family protein